MDSSLSSYKGGLQGYWKRRACAGTSRRRRSLPEADLGRGGAGAARRGSRSSWSWRIKAAPRMSFFGAGATSPRRLIARFRDAYVRMMLGFARAAHTSTAPRVTARPPQLKEYDDEKVIVEIYKSLVTAAVRR
ncbi:uncharacterized protein LOC141847165 [Curcuma longa]|uniref:uncharacterized protein LOC141847165 n=1 Tax=Curcuma longa TaxID=136217 RepID=UPI003D9E9996